MPVAGADRLVLSEHLAVQDLVAVGRAALLPSDDLTLATVLKSPLIGVSEQALFDLAHGRGQASLWSRLVAQQDDPVVGQAFRRLDRWRDQADRLRPFEFYTRILVADGGRKQLIARLGHEAGDVIDEFLTLAADADRSGPSSLERFLHDFNRREVTLKREQEEQGQLVRVMTVHGAKGLQAPIVFLPDTTRTRKPHESLLIYEDAKMGAVPLYPGLKDNRVGPALTAHERAEAKEKAEDGRLLYVAMTRAEDELVICGWQADARQKEPSPHSWYQIMADGLDRLGVPPSSEDQPVRVHALGDPVIALTPRQEMAATAAGDAPDWLFAPVPSEPRPSRPLAPSRPDQDGPGRVQKDPKAFQRGTLIHRLLESLPDQPPAQWERAAQAFLSLPGHGLSARQVQSWTAEVMAVLTHPDYGPLFGPGSRAEVPLCGVVDGNAIVGRVDRLIVREDDVIILDYKTNRPPPTDPSDIPPHYVAQMADYAAVLSSYYPTRKIRPVLLWTDGPSLMTVNPV